MSATETIAASASFTRKTDGPRRPILDVLRAVLRQPAGVIGGVIVLVYVLVAVAAPLISPYDPLKTDTANLLSGPTAVHWLGTDEIGRDVVSRLMHATGPALLVGGVAVLMASVIGITFGVVAGFYRGAAEAVIMRVCDVIFAFPSILTGIFAVVVLGPGIIQVSLAVGIGAIPHFARLARAEVLKLMSADYVRAARGMGSTDWSIIRRHLLPNIVTSMLVQAASAISAAIVLAAALDFLGLGTQPPDPSWGSMLQSSRGYLAVAPVFAIAPGLIITILVLGVNLFSAALANGLDPKQRTKLLRLRRSMALSMLFGGLAAKADSDDDRNEQETRRK